MSRCGICHIWFWGRHISPSMPYREARSVAESSGGPIASKSDRTGRNPGMTRLVRRSSAGCLEVLRFSLLFKYSLNACANVLAHRYLAYQKKIKDLGFFFLNQQLTFQLILYAGATTLPILIYTRNETDMFRLNGS